MSSLENSRIKLWYCCYTLKCKKLIFDSMELLNSFVLNTHQLFFLQIFLSVWIVCIYLLAEVQLKGVKTQLLSRLGFFLAIDRDGGLVKGVPDDGENTIFHLIPVGLRVVSIQHMESMLYVAMNRDGQLYASVSLRTLYIKCNKNVINITSFMFRPIELEGLRWSFYELIIDKGLNFLD